MKTAQVFVALITLVLCTRSTQSENILGIFSYTFSTPYKVVKPYFEALVHNGHNVTIISSKELLPDIENVRHIRIAALDLLIEHTLSFDYIEWSNSKWKESVMFSTFCYNMSHSILSDSEVQSLLQDKSEHFDMIVLEPTNSDALIGFADHFNASLVGLSTYGSSWLTDHLAGNSAPSIYRPIQPMGYSHSDSLLDRWNNWFYIAEEWMIDRLVILPGQLKLFTHFFQLPSSRFFERRTSYSLMIINQHFSLSRVRSNVPNIIEVAGLHMAEPSEPLEPDLLNFVNGAEHGVIYFSMGMEILNKFLPKNMEEKMLQTFAQLKQRVVWKHEKLTMLNKSDNIYLSPMASQRQLLEHPNIKLFITHGGLLSTIEAVYSGVPMLGLPIYFDQFDNVECMVKMGLARKLDINNLTEEQLMNNIKELLQNPTYALKAKEMSKRFRDQPISPIETAIWWTEYVLRHKGAPHMRMTDQYMAFFPYYKLNIFSILFCRIGFSAILVLLICVIVGNFIVKEFLRIAEEPPLFYTSI
ncbi:UDP-glycosyltransferase UGT4-like [Drosophila sulfurigaster albostrigata]|uniref:UDP-glycosyltransferase UGT4-like n=1 Tax=Drosophila sulfurigaster albostrigata TaxID=89887 RepID=UPI002D21DE19|nr:UDP-glycosyltransferase UGT4-like [Drosophila sulfurigaster albostrigata]